MLYIELLTLEGEEIEKQVWPEVEKARDIHSSIKAYLYAMSSELEYNILTQRIITNLEEYNIVSRKVNPEYVGSKMLRSVVPLMEFISKHQKSNRLIKEDCEVIAGVLRFPRREDVMPRTSAEKKVLKLVNQYITTFQAPNWSIYTDEVIAYKKLNGVPAGTIDHEIQAYVWVIDEKNVPECFHQTLGKALASLHNIPKEKAAEAGLIVHTPEEARETMKERMEAVKAKFGVGEYLWNRWQTWINNDEMWPKRTGLIHGDVHAGHIMVDKDANVTGLIDCTEAKVTDVSNDFVVYYRTFGEKGLDSLIKAYKEEGGYFWPRMKEHIFELRNKNTVISLLPIFFH